MIDTIGIAGVGLIGGSLGLACKQDRLARRVIGIGRSPERLQEAIDLGAIDDYTCDFIEGANQCDLLYLATPVLTIIRQIQSLKDITDRDIIVTDGGSVKGAILDGAATLPPNIRFVGGHPMAGSDEGGVHAARADLFKDAAYVLTPDDNTDAEALQTVKYLVEALKSRLVIMDKETHDRTVAIISHIPHVLAGIMLRIAANQPGAVQVSAGSFRDLTRVAGSPPILWRDICIANRKAILEAIRQIRVDLEDFEGILSKCDPDCDELEAWFTRSKSLKSSFSRG